MKVLHSQAWVPGCPATAEVKIPGKIYVPPVEERPPVDAVVRLELSGTELAWLTSALGSLDSEQAEAVNTLSLFSDLVVLCGDLKVKRRMCIKPKAGHSMCYPK